ncbi:hypothetical protein M231_01234 [Tremella mesenterica]|uniref:Uncharacterized protein n=2 Tax=Tremella mesenterica TaxID=5217 RepID=A0A4Q1BU08_TREME|nr:hypothetical protein M231_01234 [Tremella mesenterica]
MAKTTVDRRALAIWTTIAYIPATTTMFLFFYLFFFRHPQSYTLGDGLEILAFFCQKYLLGEMLGHAFVDIDDEPLTPPRTLPPLVSALGIVEPSLLVSEVKTDGHHHTQQQTFIKQYSDDDDHDLRAEKESVERVSTREDTKKTQGWQNWLTNVSLSVGDNKSREWEHTTLPRERGTMSERRSMTEPTYEKREEASWERKERWEKSSRMWEVKEIMSRNGL